MKKLLTISVGLFALCAAIRVPTSWTSSTDGRLQLTAHRRPSADLPQPLALAHGKYARNKNTIRNVPHPNRFAGGNVPHLNLVRPPGRPDFVPIDNPHAQRFVHGPPVLGYGNGQVNYARPASRPEISPVGNFREHRIVHEPRRNVYESANGPRNDRVKFAQQSNVPQNAVRGNAEKYKDLEGRRHLEEQQRLPHQKNINDHKVLLKQKSLQELKNDAHNQKNKEGRKNVHGHTSSQGFTQPKKQNIFQAQTPIDKPFKPVYHFDSYFNPISPNPGNTFSDQFRFFPQPKPVDDEELGYQKRKEAILLKNHRDDKTHEPSNEGQEVENERDDDESERENYENEKSEEGGEVESEEEEAEKAPVSEHEKPVEVPTRPIYPGEGKWAQRGEKHRPYISNHKYTNLGDVDDDDEKPDGHDVFDKVQDVFQRQSHRFANNLSEFPTKNKLGQYIQPSREAEQDQEEDEKEELNEDEEDEEDEEFVPTQIYTQVRKTEDEEHLPPVYEGPHKLSEVIKDSKIQTVYTEEGYEDVAYDHAGHEKEAAENEGFAEAEEEVKKEKLKKVPRLKYNNEASDDSIIEESNIDHGKRVVSPNGESVVGTGVAKKRKKKPAFNIKNNNHFMKTKEIKTTAVKDSEKGGKEMEVLSEVKVMMVPDKDGKHMKKIVQILPKKYKLPKKYRPYTKKNTEQLKSNADEAILMTTTLKPDPSDMISDTMPLPTTSTEPLSKVASKDTSKSGHNEVLKPTIASTDKSDPTRIIKSETKIRRKRFTNDFEKIEVDTAFIDDIDHSLPVKVDKTPDKYPYYFNKHLQNVHPNSALRYSEDMKNIPPKKYGEMTFYDLAQESVPCEEVETDVNPVPDRVENAEKNAKDMKESDDVAELAEAPRLKGLGDKIMCFKKRYFGENPLDSPFFKEDYIDPVTPPYNMLKFFPNQKSTDTSHTKHYPSYKSITKDDVNVVSSTKTLEKPKQTISPAVVKEVIEEEKDLSENASTLSEENSDTGIRHNAGFANEENEVNVDDPERTLKENLTDLETFEDDYDTAAEVEEEPNIGIVQDVKTTEDTKTLLEQADKDTPTKFVLSLGKNNLDNHNKKQIPQSVLDTIEPTTHPNIVTQSGKVEVPDEVITLHPDAEFVNVDKLPEPTTTEAPLNIITTPKYTIDLVPKHIYDQIELLRFLPNQTESTTAAINVNKPQNPRIETTNEELPVNLTILDVSKSSNDRNSDSEENSRQPKVLVIDEVPEAEITNKNADASDRSDEDQPESLPLRRNNRKKLRRKRPFVVFDVNRFWPTTPFPLFQQKVKLSNVKPKHDPNSEVHYKDEIKPSEQLTVLRDVLTIIRNSSLQEPLMVAESQGTRIERPLFNHGRVPIRPVSHNTIPIYHPGPVPQNNQIKTHYNRFFLPTNFGPKPTTHVHHPHVIPILPEKEEELSTKLKNTAITKNQNEEDEEDEISYYTSQDIEKVRSDDKVGSPGKDRSQEEVEETNNQSQSYETGETNDKSSQEEIVHYRQKPITEVLGLVPPGNNHYSTIYNYKPQQPAAAFVIDEASLNKFYVEGMKPPPKNQKITLYHDFKTNKPRRRIHKPRRSRRQVKSGYTELLRSRGPQFQASDDDKKTEDDDDYVPHRPKNYHYDEKTGKIVYDNVEKKEEDDELEYAVVYEEVTEQPVKLKTTTVSWIATAKPNKDEKPLLYFVEQLKKHPNYTLIPDPTTTEKGKEVEQTTTSTTSVPVSTTPPAFLNILAKVKSDSNYKLIPDKTTAKPTEAAMTEELEEAIEESKVENVEEATNTENAEEEGEKLSDLIFDISQFLPKMRTYKPKTEIDYSKYKTIERPQVSTRHNLSSRYNAENEKELQEVNTKKIPITLATESDSMESQDVSESRIHEKTSETVPKEQVAGTTVRSRRRKVSKNAKDATTTTSTTTTTTTMTRTTESALPSLPHAIETVTLSDDSLTATSPATVETSSAKLTSTITRETTTSTTQSPTTLKRVRIRGRVRATTPKATSESKEIHSKSDGGEKKTPIRRRPQRVKVKTTTEKFFEPSDLESPSKTVQRRQSYYESEEDTRQVPYRFDPVLLGDSTAQTTTQRPKIRRRPRIRINKNSDANDRNDDVTTYRVPVTTQETAKAERQPIRRRGRVNTRTRTRNNSNGANERTIAPPVRYSESITTQDPVSSVQPKVRGRSRLNRIQSSTRTINKPTFVPEVEVIPQQLVNLPTDTESKIASSAAQQFSTASLYSGQPTTAYTPTFNAYFSPDPTTPKSLHYTPVGLQREISSNAPSLSKINQDVQTVNVDTSPLNGATYYPTTPNSLKYSLTIDDGKTASLSPALVSNRRSDSDIADITLSHVPKDISTPQPFRYTAVIEDNLATTETPKVTPSRNIDTFGLSDATYFPSLSTTPQPFKYTATVPRHNVGLLRNSPNLQEIPGIPNIDSANINVSPSSGATFYPSGPTTQIPLDFSSIYSSNIRDSNPLTQTSKLPLQFTSPQVANSDSPLSNVATYFNIDSSTQRLPYSSAPTQNLRTSPLPQQSAQEDFQLAVDKNPGNINIPPPSDAYLDAYITTPLPSTIGKIIPGNVLRPTESPSIPIRRRGRIINRGDTPVNDATGSAQEIARGRAGNTRRRPQRTRGRGTSPQPQTDDPTLQVNIQPAVRQRVHQPDPSANSGIAQKVIDADKRADSEQNQSKKLNVEVYQTYNPTQRHGGNYREEDEDSLITGTVNKKNEKIVLTPEGQTGNVNVGGIRTYSHRQAYLDSLKQEADATPTVQPPLVSRNTPVTVVPTQDVAKKANVEVYKSYDTNQRHGGNYKEEDDISDVVQSATINPLGHHQSLNPERIPPKKVNAETLKNIDPKHFGVYGQDTLGISDLGSSTPNPKLQRVVLAPETIQPKRVNVEVFKEYDQNQRHGGNYRKEYEDTEVIEPTLAGGRNEKIIQSPEKVAPKTIHFEVFDSYNPKQRHGGNYKEGDESDIKGDTRSENQKLLEQPQHTPTNNVRNVEVLKQYNTKQKHGGNYKSEDEEADDADYQESEIVNNGNGDSVQISGPLQPQNVNIGFYGGNERGRVPSILMEPPKISLPALTGIPGDRDTGALNVEIFKPNVPAPRHHENLQQRDENTDEIDRINVELLKPHIPASRTNHNEEYTKKDEYKEETTTNAPSTRTVPQRRRRPLHRTTTSHPDVNTNFRGRNALRRRDPKSVRGSVTNTVQENTRAAENSDPKTTREDQIASTRSADVDVFKDYDQKTRHGGNYRRISEEDGKQGGNVRKALVEEVTERLKQNPRSKPLGLYNDPKLAKNINQLKDIRIPETVTEEIVRDVVEEEEAEEDDKESEGDVDYGWINIKAISSSTPRTVTVVTTTKPARVANVIKDPSKRLYFYAAV